MTSDEAEAIKSFEAQRNKEAARRQYSVIEPEPTHSDHSGTVIIAAALIIVVSMFMMFVGIDTKRKPATIKETTGKCNSFQC